MVITASPAEAAPQPMHDNGALPSGSGEVTLRILDLEATHRKITEPRPIFTPDGNTVKEPGTVGPDGKELTKLVMTEVPELLPLPENLRFQDVATGALHGEAGPGRKHTRNQPLSTFKVSRESFMSLAHSNSLQPSRRAKKMFIREIAKKMGEEVAIKIRKELLMQEPSAPSILTPEVAEARKPKPGNPPSVHDGVRIDVDKLQRARQKGETDITLDKMRDYVSNLSRAEGKFDEEFDKFMQVSDFKDYQEASTTSEVRMVHAIMELDKMFSAEDLGGLERLAALANKKGVEDVTTTQSTGPDFRIRILFMRKNAEGRTVDHKGKPIPEHLEILRNKLIAKASQVPEFVQGAILYEHTKQYTYHNTRMWQDDLDLMKECKFSDGLIQDTWMGTTYARKYQNTDKKNTKIHHPIEKDSDGNEIWDPILDDNKNQMYMDVKGNAVSVDDIRYEDQDGNEVSKPANDLSIDGLIAYHILEKDDHGHKTTERILLSSEIVRGINDRPVYKLDPINPTNPDGSPNYLRVPAMEDDGVTQVIGPDGNPMFVLEVERQLEAAYEPRIDWDRVMIGHLKDEEWTNELATRIVSGQLQWETDTVKQFFMRVMDYSETLDDNFYLPGFYEGKGIDITDGGQPNKAYGRQSEEYLTTARFITRLKKLVDSTRFGATSGETDESKRNEQVQEEVRKRAELVRLQNIKRANAGQPPMSVEAISNMYPPKLQSASPEAQYMFEEAAKIIDAVAARHCLGEIRWNDQSAT